MTNYIIYLCRWGYRVRRLAVVPAYSAHGAVLGFRRRCDFDPGDGFYLDAVESGRYGSWVLGTMGGTP
jgi:hypothetical protein